MYVRACLFVKFNRTTAQSLRSFDFDSNLAVTLKCEMMSNFNSDRKHTSTAKRKIHQGNVMEFFKSLAFVDMEN